MTTDHQAERTRLKACADSHAELLKKQFCEAADIVLLIEQDHCFLAGYFINTAVGHRYADMLKTVIQSWEKFWY